MIDTVKTILRLVVSLLPFICMCFADMSVNLKKNIRERQFLMPVFGGIYALVSMIFANKICSALLKLIKNIPIWLNKLSPSVGSVAERLLGSINWTYGIFVLANTVLIAVYLIYKKIILKILKRAYGKNDVTNRSASDDFLSNDCASNFVENQNGLLHNKIASHFYTYDPEENVWYIKDSYGIARKYCTTFFITAIIVSVIIFIVCRKFMLDGLITSPFYPVFGIIFMGEFLFYIQGLTKSEYKKKIFGDDEHAERVVNYSLLRKILKNLFGDHLISDDTTVDISLANVRADSDVIESLIADEDGKIEAFGKYLKALHSTGFCIDQNYVYAARDLLCGKSIVFNNPFYNDMIPYVFYPMNRALMNHKKVLVILGRHAIENDISAWITKGINVITKIPTLWKIDVLDSEEKDIDIGIITRSDVHDLEIHESNKEFFKQVGFVVILEPSKLLTTAQIGLNSLVKHCKSDKKDDIVFCSIDKNCDGLVDSLSHVLMTSIIEVSATNKHRGDSSYMCWDTDSEYLHHRMLPGISRYLGLGTELSFVAVKNQVSHTSWYGGEAYPVVDQAWIDRQYYYDLLKYAGQPLKQDIMDEVFSVSANMWSAETVENNYMTVEDESFNMYEIIRNFATRASGQGFVNVISSDYLLKDYMADNEAIFASDPKAIPFIAADYARTPRNVTLRLLLMLSSGFLSEKYISKELSLIGYSAGNVKKQVWYEITKCFSSAAFDADIDSAFNCKITLQLTDGSYHTITNDIINEDDRYNLETGFVEKVYFVTDDIFINGKLSDLFNAGYISEDERGESHYLGSELKGHVFQRYLPGQFFVFDGKYYEMQYLTGDNNVLVRRAADHIFGRVTYRQIRNYKIVNSVSSKLMGSQKDISGIKIYNEFADIAVETPAYMQMQNYNDFVNAKKITINGIPERSYMNKQYLRIVLPAADTDIIYTIAALMNEVFRTLFAENQAYICALTAAVPENENDEKIAPNTYSISGDIDENSIYIVEDSQLDLGLLVSVERNIKRIFEIICDYLEWNDEAILRSLNPQTEEEPVYVLLVPESDEKKETPKKKKGIFGRIKDWFKKIFGRKNKKGKKDKKGKKGKHGKKGKKGKSEPENTAPGTVNEPQQATEQPFSPQPIMSEDGQPEPENTASGMVNEPQQATEQPFSPQPIMSEDGQPEQYSSEEQTIDNASENNFGTEDNNEQQ